MRRRRLNFLLSVAIFSSAAALANGVAAQVTGTGSLYPPEADAPVQLISKTSVKPGNNTTAVLASPRIAENRKLAKALGPAGYILNSVGVTNEFSAIVRQAVGRHPAFHSQVSALDETRAERRRASSALYPQLSTQFRGDYSIARDFGQNTDNAVEALRPREQFTAGISASQLVFDGGATFQRIKSARARNSEFKNAISTRINDLSLASLAAYHDYATHQALLALGDAFILRHAKILGRCQRT